MAGSTTQMLMVALFIALLYYVTLPGVFITLPSESSGKMVKNLTHSLVFAALFVLSYETIVKQVAKL